MRKQRRSVAAPRVRGEHPAHAADRHAPVALIATVVAALAVFAVLTYRAAFRIPFLADDYLFLERAWKVSFASLWGMHGLIFDYYRPWSRELQYWLGLHLFGPVEWPFHVMSFVLWVGTLTLFMAFVRRVAGVTAAVIATAGAAALAGWGPLMLWIPGMQELWMIAFAMAFMVAIGYERMRLALLFLVLALLSKETAVVLLVIAVGYALMIERRSVGVTLRRTALQWGVVVVFALFHPLIGGRLWGGGSGPAQYGWSSSSPLQTVGRLLLTPFNLDKMPAPSGGWVAVTIAAALSLIPLAFLVIAAGTRRGVFAPVEREKPGLARIAIFGGLWAVIAWLPAFAPNLPWQAYYALLGLLGVWMIGGVLLRRVPWLALVLVVALVFLHAGRAATPEKGMGSEWNLVRAGTFVNQTRASFKARYPRLPPNSRVYLANVPGSVGLIPSDQGSVVLRVWYGDPTLRAFYQSHYLPRRPGDPAGTDYILSYNPSSGWVQDQMIPWNGHATYDDWENYARSMYQFGRYQEAANALGVLVKVRPKRADYALELGRCYLEMEDTTEAVGWFRKVAGMAGVPDSVGMAARQFARLLGS